MAEVLKTTAQQYARAYAAALEIADAAVPPTQAGEQNAHFAAMEAMRLAASWQLSR